MPANKRGRGRFHNHGGYNQRNQHQTVFKNEPASTPSKHTPPSGGNSTKSTPSGGNSTKHTLSPSGGNSAKSQSVPEPRSVGLQDQGPNEGMEATKWTEKKFTQRSRLFVGNMPLDMTEQQFKDLFTKYGEISETFINANKGFGFVRLDTRANAERAKSELDSHMIKNRPIRVRFASHGAAVNIKHLSPYVSNELLEQAFTRFGPVERAVVIVDDRGKPTGRGIVEFARKSSATKALQQISEGCFLLTSSPQAIVVKSLEQEDMEDGLSEKNIPKNQQYSQEREGPPRFAQPGTFECEFAMRWKALEEMERQQQEQLDKSIASARQKLESEMENAIHEHRTMLMKQELMRKQDELSRIEEQRKRELERRKQLEYAREDQHKKELEALAQRQEILRAQVEGTFQHSEQGRNSRGFGPGPNAMMQEALAMEMMAGGQGGLGPASSRQERFEQALGSGRPFPPPPGPPSFGGPPQGFGAGQRRRYGGGPEDFDNGQKRRRY